MFKSFLLMIASRTVFRVSLRIWLPHEQDDSARGLTTIWVRTQRGPIERYVSRAPAAAILVLHDLNAFLLVVDSVFRSSVYLGSLLESGRRVKRRVPISERSRQAIRRRCSFTVLSQLGRQLDWKQRIR